MLLTRRIAVTVGLRIFTPVPCRVGEDTRTCAAPVAVSTMRGELKFCVECAVPLTLKPRCPQCGFENPPRAKFCGACATPLTVPAAAPGVQPPAAAGGQAKDTTPQPAKRAAKGASRGMATSRAPSSQRGPRGAGHTAPEGERRQLTVMFIDLVGSTTLSQQLDPEDYHARVVAYQAACRQVIARYEGHIAQYLGDGVLVYFGYPAAHEDDAVRAVRSGLEIVTAVSQLAYTPPLQVRIGIHTGPVVVGEIGAGEQHGDGWPWGRRRTLPRACKGMPSPIRWSSARRPIGWCRACLSVRSLGPQTLKGVATPLSLYRVMRREAAQSRFEVAVQNGLDAAGGPRTRTGLVAAALGRRPKKGQAKSCC